MAKSRRAGSKRSRKVGAGSVGKGEIGKLMVAQLRRAPVILSDEDVGSWERQFATTDMTRQMALLLLSRPGAWLIDEVEKDRDFAVQVAGLGECLDAYAEELGRLQYLVQCAHARAVAVLRGCEDREQLLAEARASVRR